MCLVLSLPWANPGIPAKSSLIGESPAISDVRYGAIGKSADAQGALPAPGKRRCEEMPPEPLSATAGESLQIRFLRGNAKAPSHRHFSLPHRPPPLFRSE
jgi:hypothetical protein